MWSSFPIGSRTGCHLDSSGHSPIVSSYAAVNSPSWQGRFILGMAMSEGKLIPGTCCPTPIDHSCIDVPDLDYLRQWPKADNQSSHVSSSPPPEEMCISFLCTSCCKVAYPSDLWSLISICGCQYISNNAASCRLFMTRSIEWHWLYGLLDACYPGVRFWISTGMVELPVTRTPPHPVLFSFIHYFHYRNVPVTKSIHSNKYTCNYTHLHSSPVF